MNRKPSRTPFWPIALAPLVLATMALVLTTCRKEAPAPPPPGPVTRDVQPGTAATADGLPQAGSRTAQGGAISDVADPV